MKVSIPRLASVKFKNGPKLHILRNTMSEGCCRAFKEDCTAIVNARGSNMAGFAVVAWSTDGAASTAIRIHDSRQVGQMMAPDFVRAALLQHIAGGS